MPQNLGSIEDLISKNTQSSAKVVVLREKIWALIAFRGSAVGTVGNIGKRDDLGTSSNGTRVSEEDGGSIVASSPVQHQQEGDYRKSRWNHIWRVFILEGCKNKLCHLQVSGMPLDLSEKWKNIGRLCTQTSLICELYFHSDPSRRSIIPWSLCYSFWRMFTYLIQSTYSVQR